MEQLIKCPSTCMSKRVKLPYGEVMTVKFILFPQDSCMYAFVPDQIATILKDRHPRFVIIPKNEYPIGIDAIRIGSASSEKPCKNSYSTYPSDEIFIMTSESNTGNDTSTFTPTATFVQRRLTLIEKILSFIGVKPHQFNILESTNSIRNATNVLRTRK